MFRLTEHCRLNMFLHQRDIFKFPHFDSVASLVSDREDKLSGFLCIWKYCCSFLIHEEMGMGDTIGGGLSIEFCTEQWLPSDFEGTTLVISSIVLQLRSSMLLITTIVHFYCQFYRVKDFSQFSNRKVAQIAQRIFSWTIWEKVSLRSLNVLITLVDISYKDIWYASTQKKMQPSKSEK